MLQSHWYFQQELCNTGLLLITTSICNLNDYWLSPNSFSNNISFYSVNTRLFTNPNFQNIDSTLGYIPKQDVFLYASYNGQGKPKWQDLVYLGNTNHYDPGTPGGEPNAEYPFMNKKYWGNPFHYQTANQQVKMYISATNPTTIQKTQLSQQASVTETDEPVFQECRYNPYADKGYGNECYFLSNTISKKKVWDPPDNKKLYNFGYPIWLLLWGWGDWQLKLKEINQIGINYQLIFKTDKILPKLPAYIPVNYNFVYVDEDSKPLTETDKLHWYPKYDFQLNTISNICDSGPGTYQFDDTNSVQANCNYCFYFKWGGCPAPMEGVKDPCNQPQFPIPNQVTEGFKIQDPNTNKKNTYTCLTNEDKHLQKLLKKEYAKTLNLKNLCSQMETYSTSQQHSRKEKDIRDIIRGRRENTTTKENRAPQAQAATPPQATQQTNQTSLFRITKCINKIELFPSTPKNRRYSPIEYKHELDVARAFRRPPKAFVYDPPFYPWLPPEPLVNLPYVNFRLNFKE